ncbi:hypothetical protein L208DRAFT_1378238 [Tricholoma matsutake]|nr:hypothetical protein L208DRAFT_1378238 [Tricholoma matsutake 945]
MLLYSGIIQTSSNDYLTVLHITVRISVNPKVTTDVDFPADIPHDDFFSQISAIMNLDPMVAELGWKSCSALLSNTSCCKFTWMEIIHLNPAPVETSKGEKTDGNHIIDFAYANELHLVKEKLCCTKHGGLNHWCYIHPNTPGEHVALGLQEITLWARKIHDNEADRDCVIPPETHCLDSLNHKIRPSHAHHAKYNTLQAPTLPPIHYELTLAVKGIVYAKGASYFEKDYYVSLGMVEGRAGPFLHGVKKAIVHKKRAVKKAKLSDKENFQSDEI